MPGAQQRESILEIMLREHMADAGITQVDVQLAANAPPSPSEPRPLQLIAERAVGLSGEIHWYKYAHVLLLSYCFW